MANEFIKQHDEAEAAGRAVHRVTAYIAGHNASSLRADMEAYAAGAEPSKRLHSEFCAYSYCTLDETRIEAVHRDVSHISRKATASSVAFRAATLRLRQNLQAEESQDLQVRQWMRWGFGHWKAIGQVIVRKADAGIGSRRSARNGKFFQWLYRYGMESLQDWGHLKAAMNRWLPKEANVRAAMSLRLKLDYLQRVLRTGQCFTIPKATDAAVDAAIAGTRDAAAATVALQDAAMEWYVFVPLDLNPAAKKLVRTAHSEGIKAMAFPVVMQEYEVCTGPDWLTGRMHVCPAGIPRVVDIIRIGQWPAVRHGMRTWERGPVDGRGFTPLAQPALCDAGQWNMREPGGPPAIVLVDALVSTGWIAGTEPRRHTPASHRIVAIGDPIQQRHYLQCLLLIQDLWDTGMPTGLPSGQHPKYYELVMQATEPQTVPADLDGPGYAAWQANRAVQPREAASQPPDPDAPVGSLAGKRAGATADAAAKRRRGGQHAAGAADTGDALWRPMPRPEVQAQEQAASGSQGRAPTGPRAPAAMAAADIDMPIGDIAPQPRRPHADSAPLCIEGVIVGREDRGRIGDTGAYRRIMVTCPSSIAGHCGKTSCAKCRGVGLTQVAEFGPNEPYAFLGVWLAARDRFADRAAHMQYTPTREEVGEYMRAQGWM